MSDQNQLSDVIRVIAPTSTGVVEFGSEFIDDYINVLSDAVGDEEGWISWFVFENEFGSAGLSASINGEKRTITNARELWAIIKEANG